MALYPEDIKETLGGRLDKAYENAVNSCDAAQAVGIAGNLSRRPSLREENEKLIGYHRTEADKADRAVAFFRKNPAFDEFVRLLREGVISI